MRSLYLTAVLVLMAAPAYAQGFSFDYNGKNIKIDIPKNCRDISCISVKSKDKDEPQEEPAAAPANPSTAPASTSTATAPAAPATASAPATAAAPPAAPAAAPAPTASANPADQPLQPPPLPRNDTTQSRLEPPPLPATPAPQFSTPAPAPAPAAAAPATPAPTATASAAPAEAPKAPAPAASLAPTPVGVWMTEKNEGKVRIEECGKNLCGYEVLKTDRNGKQVLVDMRPTKSNEWAGKINDIRSGGTYTSTIALRNNNTLRVEGCAFGGMFCGGQTWKRAE